MARVIIDRLSPNCTSCVAACRRGPSVTSDRSTKTKLRIGSEGRGGRWRFQLPWQDAFNLPDADLPVDPYTLGVWLGDGSTAKPAITHDPADTYELPYPVISVYEHATTGVLTTYYGGGLFAELLALGVATRDYGVRSKHIPDVYLRASTAQRWDLLCGLVDSDGTIALDKLTDAIRDVLDEAKRLDQLDGFAVHDAIVRALRLTCGHARYLTDSPCDTCD